jgi:hypothetical protein
MAWNMQRADMAEEAVTQELAVLSPGVCFWHPLPPGMAL